jgi:hypothetical protein
LDILTMLKIRIGTSLLDQDSEFSPPN